MLVYSRAEVNQWGHQPGTALYWALREGRVVHSRESLYKSLSGERAPSRDTLFKVMRALGFKLTVQPITPA